MQPTLSIICSSPGYGGLEMNTLKLAKLLTEKGWKTRLLVNDKSRMAAEGKAQGLTITTLKKLGASKPNAFVIKKWMQDNPADILFTPYNKDIAALSFYKLLFNRRIKLVYQQHMKVGMPKRDLIHTLRYRSLDLWISPLGYLKDETLQNTRMKAEKIITIPLGIEPKRFAIPLGQEAARLQLGLPQHAFIIGVLGRIDPKKGQDFLIRSMPAVAQKLPSAQLLIMGDVTPYEGDSYLQSLHRLTEKLGLKNRVIFMPGKQEVIPFYKALDVFAMPSHGETYGMVTLEAMASGTPVVGVNREGTKELLQSGMLGWLHNLDDEAGFVNHILAIADGEGVAKRTAAARAEVETHYSQAHMITRMDEALRNLLNGG
jgi:D-inositol-3-phosphate glycosyltransferase